MPKKASSGVALNNFVRNIFSCVGAIAAAPLISAIGNGWLFTGLGVIAMASSVVIWAMRKYGPRWRTVMDRELGRIPQEYHYLISQSVPDAKSDKMLPSNPERHRRGPCMSLWMIPLHASNRAKCRKTSACTSTDRDSDLDYEYFDNVLMTL